MKKKGFTLIELMIVLAIIAILSVVLIPKAGILKNQAKNAGVNTNVNLVRAYLETKTGRDFFQSSKVSEDDKAADLLAAINAALSDGSDILTNPLGKTKALYVVADEPTDLSSYDKGSVIVVFDENISYTVFGIDNGGAKISREIIKK
jgi:type IV pilus assembly protein PilA